MTPDVFMIGGANGAGKTTAALALLPRFLEVYELVNADEIARGLNPVKPETADLMAGRVMIERMEKLIESRKNFVFETTCAGHHHIKTLQQSKKAGYRLNLIFLWLPSAEMAVQRVAQRVKEGGHFIPEVTIHRRYINGLQNMVKVYLPMADEALILDSSRETPGSYPVIAEKTLGKFVIRDQSIWQLIEKSTENE